MTKFTPLRVTGLVANDGWVATGTASVLTAINDSSDSTYIRKPASSSPYGIYFTVANPSPALPTATEFIYSFGGYMRYTSGTTTNCEVLTWTGLVPDILGEYAYDSMQSSAVLPATIATVTAGSRAATGIITVTTAAAHGLFVDDLIMIKGSTTGTPANFINQSYEILTTPTTTTFTAQDVRGAQAVSTANATNGNITYFSNFNFASAGGVTQDKISGTPSQVFANNLQIHVTDYSPSATRATLYELIAYVITADLPTCTITSIDGDTSAPFIVTSTTLPTLQWTHAQADGIGQAAYAIKVFTAAEANPDAPVNTPLVNVASTGSTASYTFTTALTVGTTYYIYVKTGCEGYDGNLGGVLANYAYSAWNGITALISATPPTVPTLSLSVWDTTNQRLTATITGALYAAGTQTFELQRSDDGGTTWYTVRGASALVPNGSYVATIIDYEATRNITARYRARAVGIISGPDVPSAWSTVATRIIPTSPYWTFRALSDTTQLSIVQDVKVRAELQTDQEESVGVFRPLGSDKSVVVHGELTGYDGVYEIFCGSSALLNSMLTLINSQAVILVVDPFNNQKYIEVTDRSWNTRTSGTSLVNVSDLTVNYVETDSGLNSAT